MKKIRVTYDAAMEVGDKLEYGEAAATLDFITDHYAAELKNAVENPHGRTVDGRAALFRVTEILINLERLRGRFYTANSIKSVEIIGE